MTCEHCVEDFGDRCPFEKCEKEEIGKDMHLQPHEHRLLDEYFQLKERHEKLYDMLQSWDNLDFEPICTFEQLETQYKAMSAYIDAIKARNDFKELAKLVKSDPALNYLMEEVSNG